MRSCYFADELSIVLMLETTMVYQNFTNLKLIFCARRHLYDYERGGRGNSGEIHLALDAVLKK
jgi:hypothetical protein